jgi:inositol phosphorylceramide synthase catalytic subunit
VIIEKFKNQDSGWERYHTFLLLGFTAFFIGWLYFIVDPRIDHLYFYLLIFSCMVISKETRNFALGFCFFTIFWILYDSLRVFPNYTFSNVHFSEPYNLEKSLFGIESTSGILTPNEYFKINNHPILDVITAIFYITWVPIPLALSIFFFMRDRKLLLQFTACFLFCNLVGFIGYYTYPAAPPWYYELYGANLRFDIGPNAGGLLRFDKIVGFPLFEGLYQKNSNVFAAIPSMHSAFPVVTFYFATKKSPNWLKWLIFIDIIGIWFSAIYTNHHYIIDVALGFLCAIISIFLFEKVLLKTKFSNFIANFASKISH